MNIVIVGRGDAYGGLADALAARGHEVLLLTPCGAAGGAARRGSFSSFGDLKARYLRAVRACDLAVVCSHLPEGVFIGAWVIGSARGPTLFLDENTPETLALLSRDACGYLSHILVRRYALYLSSTGGADLARLTSDLRVPRARWLSEAAPAARAEALERYAMEALTPPLEHAVGA